jgi:hypothetical protein
MHRTTCGVIITALPYVAETTNRLMLDTLNLNTALHTWPRRTRSQDRQISCKHCWSSWLLKKVHKLVGIPYVSDTRAMLTVLGLDDTCRLDHERALSNTLLVH